MSKFVVTKAQSPVEILKFAENTATSVIVSDVGIEEVNGKKIVLAGTILGGTTKSIFTDPNEPVTGKNTADANGVLLSDVDVTYGDATGALVIFGFIDVTKLPEAPTAAAMTALNMIKFMK